MEHLLTMLLIRWLRSGQNSAAVYDGQLKRHRLVCPAKMKWGMYVCLGLLEALFIMPFFFPKEMGESWLLFGIALLLITGFGGMWLYDTVWTQVSFDEKRVWLKRLGQREEGVLWERLSEVTYSHNALSFRFKTRDNKAFRVGIFCNGLLEFCEVAHARAPEVSAYLQLLVKKHYHD